MSRQLVPMQRRRRPKDDSNIWKWKAELLSARLRYVMGVQQAMVAEIARLEGEKAALRQRLGDQVMETQRARSAALARDAETPKRKLRKVS